MNENVISTAKLKKSHLISIILYSIAALSVIIGIIITEGDVDYLFFDYGLPFVILASLSIVAASLLIFLNKDNREFFITDKRVYLKKKNLVTSLPISMISSVSVSYLNTIIISTPSKRIIVSNIENLDEIHTAVLSLTMK